MNAVGIDISKGKSMICVLQPFGKIVAKPFEVQHTLSSINHLIAYLKGLEGETRIVMEHTGRYYEPMAKWLGQANLFVSAVNPKLIKDFSINSLRKVKTDKPAIPLTDGTNCVNITLWMKQEVNLKR